MIFTGLNTPDRAQFAKFAQDFSSFQEAVTNAFLNEKMKLSTSGQYRTDEQIYYKIATGEDTQETPPPSGMVADLGLELQGTNFYQISAEEVAGVKVLKKFTDGADNLYLTDKGEVFALPGFLVEENGTNRWYVDASHYYEDETGVDHATTLSEKGYAVGQAVNYHASATNTGYAEETEVETGVTVKANTYPEDVTWHILSVNDKTGVIKITPGVVNVNKVTLLGVNAYMNPALGLDFLCNELYKNTTLNLPVKNMTLEELCYAANDYQLQLRNEAEFNVCFYEAETDLSKTSGDTATGVAEYVIVEEDDNTITVNENGTLVCYTKKAHKNDIYGFYINNGEIMYGGRTGPKVNNYDCIEPYSEVVGNNTIYYPIFVRSTNDYFFYPKDEKAELLTVLGGSTKYGILATPVIYLNEFEDYVTFGVNTTSGRYKSVYTVTYSYNFSESFARGLLPVVTLNASRLTNAGSNPSSSADPGSDENPWGIK